jgi:hypothetical protein
VKTKRLISFSAFIYKRLRAKAKKTGTSVSELVRSILLAAHERGEF